MLTRYLLISSLLCVLNPGSAFSKETEDEDADNNPYLLNPLIDRLEYGSYAKLVVKILRGHEEVDKHINEDYEKGSLQAGKVERNYLELLPPGSRIDLDELKRLELQRIKKLGEELQKRGESESSIRLHIKSSSSHVDLQDLTKFGLEDLRKLVKETTKDIENLDAMRRARFKEYEMHKRLELEELRKRLSPTELAHVDKNIYQMYVRHKQKKRLHLPASKAHLLDVWEERDHMDKDTFNIKTFFHMHDLDGNGFMDEDEVKTLIASELQDQYNPEDEDFDQKERDEEMERMREYVFGEADTDKDHLVSVTEFIKNAEVQGLKDSHFWDVLNEEHEFSEEEYEQYALKNRKEVNKMIDEGLITLPETGVVKHKDNKESAGK